MDSLTSWVLLEMALAYRLIICSLRDLELDISILILWLGLKVSQA